MIPTTPCTPAADAADAAGRLQLNGNLLSPDPINDALDNLMADSFGVDPDSSDHANFSTSSGEACSTLPPDGPMDIPFDPDFTLAFSNSIHNDQPNSIDTAAVDDKFFESIRQRDATTRVATCDAVGPSSPHTSSPPTGTQAPVAPITPAAKFSPVSNLLPRDSPVKRPVISKQRKKNARNAGSPPAKLQKEQPCSLPTTPTSTRPPRVPRGPGSGRRKNAGRRRKPVSTVVVQPIVDEVVKEVEMLHGAADLEAVEDAFARHLARATKMTEDSKIREREKLRTEVSEDAKHVAASRMEAKLSRFRKDEYVTRVEGELRDVLQKLYVLRKAYLQSKSVSQENVKSDKAA